MKKTFAVVLMLLAMATTAFAEKKGDGKATLKKVASSKVCMINEHFMDKEQIPVVVEGKTYYGCCEMCKKALAADASKRSAIDPVSGLKVDKAVAVIGADASGRVFYFENEANLEKFTPPSDGK